MDEHKRPATGIGTKTRSQVATIGDIEDALREVGASPSPDRTAQDASRDQSILELAKQINELRKDTHRAIQVSTQIDELTTRQDALEDALGALESAAPAVSAKKQK